MNATLDEALTQALRPLPAPDALRLALMEAARAAAGTRRAPVPLLRRLVQAGLAALLVGTAGLGTFRVLQRRARTGVVARAALADVMAAHAMDFRAPDPAPCCPGKCPCGEGLMGFEAPMPRTCALAGVCGGRACRIGGRQAACYALQDGARLYVLNGPIEGAGSRRNGPLAAVDGFQAFVWNEGNLGYVLVARRAS
jgi:hypothetical protein